MHAENKNRTVQQKSCSCKNDSNPNSFVHRVILIQNEVRDEMRWSTFLFCEHRHSRLQSTRLFKHPCDKKKTSRHAIRGKDSIKLTARPTFKPVTFPVSLTFFSNLIPSPHLIRPLCPAFFSNHTGSGQICLTQCSAPLLLTSHYDTVRKDER